MLIDVEMCACQLTSRVKQAISAVQMFVQRCFLNLEQAFVQVSRESLTDTHSSDNWRQWKWMKSYRVWEANRKVFLYPENWLEPDLRDDSSPFFDDLDSELLQSDLTDDLAETAFIHYLEKVHEVVPPRHHRHLLRGRRRRPVRRPRPEHQPPARRRPHPHPPGGLLLPPATT